MDRRKTLKTLLTGTLGATLVAGCDSPADLKTADLKAEPQGYGLRLPHEIAHDKRIANESFFTEAELDTLGILGDIIAPGEPGDPKATETGLREFLEFMALDQPDQHQTRLRGGVAWINSESQRRFGKPFAEILPAEQINIVDDIAYPLEAKGTPMEFGSRFFEHLRFLTLTCYFTSKAGMMKVLGYQGNQPNVWDGVPQEVLDKHGLAYDPKYLPLYVNQDRREEIAAWDENKNLLNNG
ncbi:gluconate 2-dehydrogenase subunit 3 family protein [Neolewinella lacunae]|uniref:Gluconate 2-dehydrogenase subunit 3 family protein n=1 Tax=Neolewinella lacunae TaxID=1517758 RepID=A0A923PRT7_9BACT|nr:gluconate 2-dehydrogenase subunit 3 family protein [Neolewinella lacunae]MBC6996586.1 gluconate 2-dehydrogenase subunit 3 family protein [Neolewinella lacunae]MDN3634850.1 gluconate 2-dehydrogenase subunit 3 family protein [Neolewinella lacunae]